MPIEPSSAKLKNSRPNSREGALPGQRNNLNPKVSDLSNFEDEVWDFVKEAKIPSMFKHEKRICWDFIVKDEEHFTLSKYAEMLLATKQLFYSLLRNTEEGPAHKPTTIIQRWRVIKEFIIYLATRPRPILAYSNISPEVISRYIKHLKKKRMSSVTLYVYFRPLAIIFQYRRKMCNSLRFDPFIVASAGKEAGYDSHYREQHRTEYIPDSILIKLIKGTLEFSSTWGPQILKASALVDDIRKRAPEKRDYTIRYHIRRALQAFNDQLSCDLTSTIRPALSNLDELNQARIRLRTACGILIAFVTGIRISELLSIKAGCIEIENNDDGEFIWLHSTLYKIQGISIGIAAKWLAGPIALDAVSILEQLTSDIRKKNRCANLMVPVTRLGSERWNRDEPLTEALNWRYLHDFTNFIGVKDSGGRPYHIHPHMFRRTFARHVVRSDTTNLLALKEHFKHCSVAMTDGYVGIDEELQELLDQESDLASLDSFDKALRSTHLSGRRGKEIVRMIDTAIGDGRLPVEFRGESGSQFRKKMIKEFVEAGQQIYPCGAGNFCWFRQQSADCTKGDRPVIESCNPLGCANSVIDRDEHGPFWRHVVTEGESLLALKPKAGPYRARLTSITRIAKKVVSDLES